MINTNYVFVATSPTVTKLVDLPPGPASVTISNTGGSAISVGPGSNVTINNGVRIAVGQSITLPIPAGAKAQSLYVTGVTGTADSSYVIVTPN